MFVLCWETCPSTIAWREQTFHYYFCTNVSTEKNCITWSVVVLRTVVSVLLSNQMGLGTQCWQSFPSNTAHPPRSHTAPLHVHVCTNSYSKSQVKMLTLIAGTQWECQSRIVGPDKTFSYTGKYNPATLSSDKLLVYWWMNDYML